MIDYYSKVEKYGCIDLNPSKEHIAGTFASFELIYTAGIYGMDDLGGLKILFRYACDQSPLQMKKPKAVGYTTAIASNGAAVELSYYLREGERPWYKVLKIRIAGKGLKEGEKIIIRVGDQRFGSPGIRLQTFVEPEFEFRTLVDVFSTNFFKPIKSPKIALISGKPTRWKLILPTLRRAKQTFTLKIRAEDKWGNPSNQINGRFILKSNTKIDGLPSIFNWKMGNYSKIIENLSVEQIKNNESVIRIKLLDDTKNNLTISNPLVIKKNTSLLHFWGDIHGQSQETIGTNTARSYFEFARDYAFLDVIGHQANDFQITINLWKKINRLSDEFNHPGKFITLIGYEYSANTSLGGDRNVYFLEPHRQIHRSSHALIQDKSDLDTDCLSVSDLFSELIKDNPDYERSVLVIAHAGGRYADILNFHDGRLETSIEIHSAWGTFEWLLWDAFEKNYRVGIVANGDDHKGRPGSAYPGISKFGALGGLTCFLSEDLSREAIFKALKRRHHYATTGERIFLDLIGILNSDGVVFERDPALYPNKTVNFEKSRETRMGDIVKIFKTNSKTDYKITLKINIEGRSPIERIEIFNGNKLIETIKPFLGKENNNKINNEEFERIRILWEGAEFRARRRNVEWVGAAEFVENTIKEIKSFNFWNASAPLRREGPNKVSWKTMTSGNFQGFDVILTDREKGVLRFRSSQISFDLLISEISIQEKIFQVGGLGKRVRIFRLPNINKEDSCYLEKHFEIDPLNREDDRFWIKITFENGHQAWSSPIYIIKE
ncbi:MAG: DUF3604 domain-containing protein [Promethearchaeati archaeon]